MRTLIYNPSARIGGAISILKDVYKDITEKQDFNNKYIFIVGSIDLQETENVKICNFPWVQKNWINRVFFDLFIAPRLVRKYKVDRVISYQNMTIPFSQVPQTLYLQQPLPFIDKRFKFRESKKLWLYQNVICKFVVISVKKASNIIVQTEWMKKACIVKYKIPKNTIEIQPPTIFIEDKFRYSNINDITKTTFFYPASGLLYKNHNIIVEACLKLSVLNINNYRVILTLNGNENKNISNLKKICINNKLNIEFVGLLERAEVYEIYSKSILLFPSYVETFGLPLLEAKLIGAPIIASDSPFSHEILNEYNDVQYFGAFDSKELARLMRIKIEHGNSEESSQ